jgi:nucleotide-binding universal stress UspA family protein
VAEGFDRPLVVGIGPDGSGVHAARHAAGLATALGASVVLVFGYDITSMGPRGGPLEEQLAEIADEVTSGVRDDLLASNPGLTVLVELVRDKPVDSLLRAAGAHDAQAILVGHGGGGVLRAAMLGSTTYGLVHRAGLPVIVVPDPEDDEHEEGADEATGS